MSAKPRVVFLIRHFMVGGLERVILAQIPLLLERGFEVKVAVLEAGRDNALVAELDPRASVVVLPRNRLRRIRRLDRLTRGSLVLLHLGDGSLFASARPGLRHAVRTIRFCHSDYSHVRSRAKNALDRLLSLREDDVVAVGGRSTRFLLEDVGISARKMITLPNALAPVAPPSTGAIDYRLGDAGAPLLVSIQSFYPHKGHDALLEGFRKVVDREPRAVLALVGDGSENIRLWELARSLKLLDRIRWLGGLWNRLIVDDLLAQADVFVSMSRFEGVPISVLEARRRGLRLVLSDIEGHREGAADTARYVPVDDASAFAEAVISVLRAGKPPMRSTDGRGADAWDAYSERFLQIVSQHTQAKEGA